MCNAETPPARTSWRSFRDCCRARRRASSLSRSALRPGEEAEDAASGGDDATVGTVADEAEVRGSRAGSRGIAALAPDNDRSSSSSAFPSASCSPSSTVFVSFSAASSTLSSAPARATGSFSSTDGSTGSSQRSIFTTGTPPVAGLAGISERRERTADGRRVSSARGCVSGGDDGVSVVAATAAGTSASGEEAVEERMAAPATPRCAESTVADIVSSTRKRTLLRLTRPSSTASFSFSVSNASVREGDGIVVPGGRIVGGRGAVDRGGTSRAPSGAFGLDDRGDRGDVDEEEEEEEDVEDEKEEDEDEVAGGGGMRGNVVAASRSVGSRGTAPLSVADDKEDVEEGGRLDEGG